MEKEGPREGVVSVGGFIPSTQWGFPGFGGGERVLEVGPDILWNRVLPCLVPVWTSRFYRRYTMSGTGTIWN